MSDELRELIERVVDMTIDEFELSEEERLSLRNNLTDVVMGEIS